MELHVLIIRMTTSVCPINSRHITFVECFSYHPVCFMRNKPKYQVHYFYLKCNLNFISEFDKGAS